MVKFSVFYPAGESTHFDIDYYTAKHMPMAGSLLGPMGVVKAELDRPLAGLPALAADVPNFTNIQPMFQVSDAG